MEIKYIEPSVLHDEMLRLRKEKQMDFLECLSGMDWGIPDEKDAPVQSIAGIPLAGKSATDEKCGTTRHPIGTRPTYYTERTN